MKDFIIKFLAFIVTIYIVLVLLGLVIKGFGILITLALSLVSILHIFIVSILIMVAYLFWKKNKETLRGK